MLSKDKKGVQINKIRNERGKVMIGTMEIQNIIRSNYKQLYINKTDYLEETYKFLEMYNLPRLNQEERESIKRPVISNEIWIHNKKKKSQ